MKKVKSGNRRSAPKGRGAPKNVDEYLAGVPEPARDTLNKIRAAIRSAAPREATKTISYGTPACQYKGVLDCFPAFAKHSRLFSSRFRNSRVVDGRKRNPSRNSKNCASFS